MVSLHLREDCLPTDQNGSFRYDEKSHKGSRFKLKIGRKWIHATVKDWAQDIHELEITCRILEDDEACVGIWAPSEDYHSSANIGPRVHGITEEVFLEPESWKFGSEASLTLHRKKNSPLTSEIDLCFLCRPYNLTDDVKIQFDLFSKHQGERFENLYSKIFEFSKKVKDNRKKIYKMKEDYEIFDNFEAYVIAGKGNIVHPKQICTIRGLEYALNEISSEQISISYIGTEHLKTLRLY